MRYLFLLLTLGSLNTFGAAFPYITLNTVTNRLSAAGGALTYGGYPLLSNSTLNSATVFNVKYYGAKGDARKLTDVSATNGVTTIYSPSAPFTSADVGKKIWGMSPAGGLVLGTNLTIASFVDSSHVTLSAGASATFATTVAIYGTDDSDAIRATVSAAIAASPTPGTVYIPSGGYVFSKRLFNIDMGDSVPAISICGAGAGSTIFYPSMAYDTSTAQIGHGAFLTCNNTPKGVEISGFTVDGANCPLQWPLLYVIQISGSQTVLRNVFVINFASAGGSGPGRLCDIVGGSSMLVEGCHFENGNGFGTVCNSCSATMIGTYSGNCFNSGLYIVNVNGLNDLGVNFRVIGCLLDENATTSVLVENSTDVSFIGSKFMAYTGGPQWVMEIMTNSIVTAIGSEFHVYAAGGNSKGVLIDAGGQLFLQSSRMDAFGTPGIYLNNAGSFYDLGGNRYRGTLTNTGSIFGPSLPSVYFGTNVLSYSGTNLTWNGTAITVP